MHTPLLEVLDQNPDDTATWDVLADWLEERGDARAEWMRLTRDVELPHPRWTRREQLALARAEAAWFPGVDTRALGLGWRHGFVAHASLTPAHLWLLAHPALRFVRELDFSGVETVTLPPRHQLRALRCEGATRLPVLPPLELLVLLRSTATPTGAAPTRLVMSDAPEVHARPRYGMVDFRALPPQVPGDGDGRDEWRGSLRTFGSSISDPYRRLQRCGACGGGEVAQIFDGCWKFKERDLKTYTFREEVWCRGCGAFTLLEHVEDD